MEIPEDRPFLSGIAGFLPELPPDCGETVLIGGVELAGGDLKDYPVQRIAELPLHDDVTVFHDRNDTDGADVADHFPYGFTAVGKLHGIALYMQDDSIEDFFRAGADFPQAAVFGF